MTNVTKLRRTAKTKVIAADRDVRWNFKYAEPSPETEKKLKEVAQMIYRFGARHNFFEESDLPTTSLPSPVCK